MPILTASEVCPPMTQPLYTSLAGAPGRESLNPLLSVRQKPCLAPTPTFDPVSTRSSTVETKSLTCQWLWPSPAQNMNEGTGRERKPPPFFWMRWRTDIVGMLVFGRDPCSSSGPAPRLTDSAVKRSNLRPGAIGSVVSTWKFRRLVIRWSGRRSLLLAAAHTFSDLDGALYEHLSTTWPPALLSVA